MAFEKLKQSLQNSLASSTQSKEAFLLEFTSAIEQGLTDLAIQAMPVPVGAQKIFLAVKEITTRKDEVSLDLTALYDNEKEFNVRKGNIRFSGRFTFHSKAGVEISWNSVGSMMFSDIEFFTVAKNPEYGKICIKEILPSCKVTIPLV